ncbi:MAG: hypothetical protein AAB444_01440 [Patescibacteria group bacterium]
MTENTPPTSQEILPTIQDVLEAVNEFASHVDKRFSDIDKRFSDIDKQFSGIDKQFSGIREEMATKSDLNRFKLDLIDVIDEKNADLKADLTILMRKEDKKVVSLIDLLRKKSVIDNTEAAKILGMDPFPQDVVI